MFQYSVPRPVVLYCSHNINLAKDLSAGGGEWSNINICYHRMVINKTKQVSCFYNYTTAGSPLDYS